jgi:hypothetical protein
VRRRKKELSEGEGLGGKHEAGRMKGEVRRTEVSEAVDRQPNAEWSEWGERDRLAAGI